MRLQEQRGVVGDLSEVLFVETAGIHPVDKIDRGQMGIGAERAAGDYVVPSLIADIDPKRGALGAEGAR